MLGCSQANGLERTGSQVGTEPGAGLELPAKSWEAAVPHVPYIPITHPCLVFAWVGLSSVGLSSFSKSRQRLPVIHLAPRLGAFPDGARGESRYGSPMPSSEPLANTCWELKGEDGE